MKYFLTFALALGFCFTTRAADTDRTVKLVASANGAMSTTLKGRVKGNRYIDYQLRAAAGQRLKASLKSNNGMNYFNILPPGSNDAAMFIGSTSGYAFDGLLPDDGIFTVRVYMMRAGARRNEQSDFRLSLALTGKPLLPLASKIDAVIPGTHFHASTTVPCVPAYNPDRQCEALVIRRGHDGTATVELRWETESKQAAKRRILFVKGTPVAADVPQTMTFTRDERGWKVSFEDNEHFEVPEPLIFGG